MTREPLFTAAGITAGAAALIALLIAFGLDLTQDQTVAILGVVGVGAPILVALLSRSQVTPVADPKAPDGVPLVRKETVE